MKLWANLREAAAGWLKILKGQGLWAQHFTLTNAGLATALVIFALLAFLTVVIAALGVGMPTVSGFIAVMLVQALAVVALALGAHGTRMAVPTETPLLTILVPGVYALVAYLIVGTFLSFIGGPALLLLWLGLAWLLFRLGRVVAGWTPGVSAAFAALTLVLLVGMPMTLYMLTGPTG